MRILAIDTSTNVMGISILDNDKILAEYITNMKKNHSTSLMPAIDRLLEEVNWLPADLELIAVAKGPGSYTGVRIGVTTAKTLAWTLNIPLVGVSTLESMAYSNHYFKGLISPIIDARRGQVYSGLYGYADNKWQCFEHDRIIMFDEWVKKLDEYQQEILFVGDDVQLHLEKINQLSDKATVSLGSFSISRPSILGTLAESKFRNGEIDNTFDFAPAYLQLAEAETKWLEKQKLL